jgi:hypothetical protein
LLIGSGGSKPCPLSFRTYSKGLWKIHSVGSKHTCQESSYLKTQKAVGIYAQDSLIQVGK